MACLRAVVKLLDRLQLSSIDNSNTGDDAVHSIAWRFNRYSTALLKKLDPQHEMVSSLFFCLRVNPTTDFGR